MNRVLKYLLVAAFVALFALASPSTVFAGGMPDFWDQWERERQALQDQIRDMERQLSDANRPAPTPRPAANPNIRLVQPQSIVLNPGEVQYVDVVVRNIGNAVANNTLVTATTSADASFSVEFINNSNVLGNVAQNNERIIRMRLSADANAAANTHNLRFEFAYRTRDENVTSDDSISVRIDAQAQTPQIMLRNFTTNTQQIFPGDSFVVSAEFINLGEGNAYNVQATIADGLDSDGIFLSGSPNAPFLQTMTPGYSRQISFEFTASSRISSGTFPIVFELAGRDHAGDEISERFTYFLTVVAPLAGESRAFLSLSAAAPGGVFRVNERATISLVITNNGNLPARNIRVAANTNAEAIVPQSADRDTIGVLEPGASHALSFAFSPTAEASSQYHTIGFEVRYDTGASGDIESDSFEQFVGINVYNPERDDENRASRPRILVTDYTVYPNIVSAGREFDLFLTFQNTSSTRPVQNIKVTLAAVEYEERSGAVFTTVGASNTFFVESMAPGESAQHQLRMFTVPNALPRTYNIEVIFEYEDEDFEEFTERDQLSINVRQVTRLEVDGLMIPSHATQFQPVFVDFSIINSGRVTLSSLRIAMEGDSFDNTGMNIWVGNMGMGNSANYSGQFTPMELGEQHGVLIVSGEDAIGELVEFRQEFTIFVDEMMVWDEMGMMDDMFGRPGFDDMMDMPTEGGLFNGILPWIIGALVIIGLGAATTIIVVRKRRNKRDLFEDLQ